MDWQFLMLEGFSKDEFECACGVVFWYVDLGLIIRSSGDDCSVWRVALVAPFTLLL